MSDSFSVKSSKHTYQVRFEDDFACMLNEHLQDGDVVLVDANVLELYNDRLKPILDRTKHLVVEPSEDQKSYLGVAPFIEHLIETGFRRNNRLFAIGGGITQDITSFLASVMYRGVDWIFYPTTLLAQGDSCIGSKTSINFGKYKNQLGGFYPPKEIVIDLRFLKTLSDLDIRSGMGEMIHYYLVSGEEDFQRMLDEYELALKDDAVLRALILHSLEFKRSYIERDEFDQGPRNVFNYGHSFGHAIETMTHYAVPHGIAVSFGMDIANYISVQLGLIPDELRQRVRKLLAMNWGDIRLTGIDVEDFKKTLLKDKKAVGTEVRVILTRGLGDMFKTPLAIDEQTSKWLEACLAGYA